MKDVKLSKDGKYRIGRTVVVQNSMGLWMYKTTGLLAVRALQ